MNHIIWIGRVFGRFRCGSIFGLSAAQSEKQMSFDEDLTSKLWVDAMSERDSRQQTTREGNEGGGRVWETRLPKALRWVAEGVVKWERREGGG